jgi:hypothetical protein
MTKDEIRDQIFMPTVGMVAQGVLYVEVDNLPLESLIYTNDSIIFRTVETVSWVEGDHYYYEYEVLHEKWKEAIIENNVIVLPWSNGTPLQIEVFLKKGIDLNA